jgi:hypothetical protein
MLILWPCAGQCSAQTWAVKVQGTAQGMHCTTQVIELARECAGQGSELGNALRKVAYSARHYIARGGKFAVGHCALEESTRADIWARQRSARRKTGAGQGDKKCRTGRRVWQYEGEVTKEIRVQHRRRRAQGREVRIVG